MEREVLLSDVNKGYLTGTKNLVGNLGNNPVGSTVNIPVKYTYIFLGVLLTGLGAIGTVVPLIPTTPFIIFAAICFGKSSPKLHTWFISTGFYKKSVSRFVQSRSMTVKAKVILLGSITLFMGLSFITMIFLSAPLIAMIILIVIWLCHMFYFGFKVKTIA